METERIGAYWFALLYPQFNFFFKDNKLGLYFKLWQFISKRNILFWVPRSKMNFILNISKRITSEETWHDEKWYTPSRIWDSEGSGHVDYRVVTRDTVQSGINLPNPMASHPRTQPPSIQLIHLMNYMQPAAQVFDTCAGNDATEDRDEN